MDAMLDLETLGVKPGSVILSIGAVLFDPHGAVEPRVYDLGGGPVVNPIHATFHAFLNAQEQTDRRDFGGGLVDGDTVMWWIGQSDAARTAMLEGQKNTQPVLGVLVDFAQWLCKGRVENIWCHGATFDAPLLQALYESYRLPVPWKFRCVRDTRTVFDLAGRPIGSFGTPDGVSHDALSDAIWQAKETVKAIDWIRQSGESWNQ